MTVLLQRESLPVFQARVAALAADAAPRWGVMSAERMLAHLQASMDMSLGAIEVEDKSNLLTRTLVRWLFFHVLPWPKGKIKAPAVFFPEPSSTFEEARQRLLDSLEAFVDQAEQTPTLRRPSPGFGMLTLAYWRRVNGLHLDHHLRQFGV